MYRRVYLIPKTGHAGVGLRERPTPSEPVAEGLSVGSVGGDTLALGPG